MFNPMRIIVPQFTAMLSAQHFSRVTLLLLLFGVSLQTLIAQQDTIQVAKSVPDSSGLEMQPRTSVFTVTADDLDAELESQDISGLLQSSRDIYTSTAGFNFGSARYRIRGYQSNHTRITINGVLMNDLESGWAQWFRWGGLNDVTRSITVRTGVQESPYNFGGIGGFSEISLRPTEFRPGTRLSYASSNRAYRNRLMVTHSTGMMDNGWAFTVSASRRWAEEGYVEGSFFDAGGYFVGAEKKINRQHSLGFVVFGAPVVQGRQGLAIQEAYDLAGTNFYNPNWGFQNGEKRNARVTNNHTPMALLTHYFTPDENTTVTTTLFGSTGRGGITGLNWYDAPDPRPDYWRNLPSFFALDNDMAGFAAATDLWTNDPTGRQINWDQFYFANRKNLFTVEDANGIAGNTITGNRSMYMVEEIRNDLTTYGVNSVWQKQLNSTTKVIAGGSFQHQSTRNFRVVEDLLGGDFWLDVDQFALRDFNNEDLAQNDLDITNRTVGVGDIFGFDYTTNVNRLNFFGEYTFTYRKWEIYAGAEVGQTEFWRNSAMRNGRFPESSFGESERETFFQYGIKAGATYKITGRHFVTANLVHQTLPPSPRFSFLSPRTRHETIPNLTTEKIFGGDLNYIVRYPRLKARATVFYTEINDQVWARSFYHDEFRTFVNYSMTGVDHLHMGTELGLETNVSPTTVVNAVLGTGQYLWNSRPTARITRDNAEEVIAEDRTVYLRNFRIGGMPQTAASLGVRYNSPKYWFAGVNANYFAHIYLDPNPDRRSEEALSNYVTDDPQWQELLQQTRLPDNYTVDAYFGKSWRVKRKYFVSLNISISNLLNNQEFAIGGFEQLRYDRTDVNKFPPRLSYLFGRTYFAQVAVSF